MRIETMDTARLRVRELTAADLDALHAYSSDERVCMFLIWGPNTREKTEAYLERAIAHQSHEPRYAYELAFVLKDTGELIGHGHIHCSKKHPEAEVEGFFNRHYWGQGYGREAIRALCAIAFQRLGLHRVYATVDPSDVAAARLLEGAGMQRDGHLREHTWAKDEWRDSLLYSILAWEFDQLLAAEAGAPGPTTG